MELFGVRIRLHPTFVWLLLIFLFAWGMPAVLSLLMVFAFVVLHELCHSLVARAHGIRVLDITLLPIGGVARLGEMPEDSGTEFRIAVAGPAFNLALAASLYGLAHLAGWPLEQQRAVIIRPGVIDATAVEIVPTLVAKVIFINLALGLFNLVPAFPMDGGRLLRAFLARRRGYVEATHRAARVGRWIAGGLVIWSVVRVMHGDWGGLWMILIAVFIYVSGKQEEFAVQARHAGRWVWRIFGYGQPGHQGGPGDAPPGPPRFRGDVIDVKGEVRPNPAAPPGEVEHKQDAAPAEHPRDPDADAAEAFRKLARQMESHLEK